MTTDVNAIITRLVAAYPLAFSRVIRPPLKVGIAWDIRAACPDLTKHQISLAMQQWTMHPDYQSNIAAKLPRVDLDGNAGKQPTDSHASRANIPFARAATLLADNPLGADLAGDELTLMLIVLDRHPQAAQKKRRMVAIRTIGEQDNKAFAVVRDDGSVDTFSLAKCFSPNAKSAAAPTSSRPPVAPIECEVTAASCKAVASLRADQLPAPGQASEVALVLLSGEVRVDAVVPGKSFRKVAAAAHGADGFVLVQGRLEADNRLSSVGISFQAKAS